MRSGDVSTFQRLPGTLESTRMEHPSESVGEVVLQLRRTLAQISDSRRPDLKRISGPVG